MISELKRQELRNKLLEHPLLERSEHIAYMVSTVHHETAGTFLPIVEHGTEEYFTARYEKNQKIAAALGNEFPGDGVKYCGRGYVQVTGRANYRKFTNLLRIDLVSDPDLALDPDVAFQIMVEGMVNGRFTGRKLADYLNDEKTDFLNARRIINGLDCAAKIAEYAKEELALIRPEVS